MLDKFGIGGNNVIITCSDNNQIESSEKNKKSKISLTLFDYIRKISETNEKTDVQSNYSEFMVNRFLSNHIDCILFTGLANRKKFINKQSHFDFLQNSITTKTKRFSKKQNQDFSEIEDILLAILLSKKWECSTREAIINLSFCNKNDKIKYIKHYQNILEDFISNNSSYLLNNYTNEEIKFVIEKMRNY